jgi:hypothetical protein
LYSWQLLSSSADIGREQWLSVAMGIHHFDYLSSEKLGYSKFLEWSKTGEDSFKGERDIKTTATIS